MSFRINTNIEALNARRHLGNARNKWGQTMERLSSGDRISQVSEDAAGLAQSEHLKAFIRGYKQASRNAQNGVSLIQVGDGALSDISDILVRLRELAIQSASDTTGSSGRGFLNQEYNQLVDEMRRISHSTEFNGVALLNGSGKSISIQVGNGNDETKDRITFDASSIDVRPDTLGLTNFNLQEKESARKSLSILDTALNRLSGSRANLGAIQSRLNKTINNLAIRIENYASANSKVRDADVAEEVANITKYGILTSAGTAILSQANSSASNALSLIQTLS